MDKFKEFTERYVAVWNEPDAERRRGQVRRLWTEDGAHLGPTLEARGHAELEARVTRSNDRWIKERDCIFVSAGNAESHHDSIRMNWVMTPRAGGEPISIGFEFLVLAADGRIRVAYQYIDVNR